MRCVNLCAISLLALLQTGSPAPEVGPGDVIHVIVAGQPTLTGDFEVDSEGTFAYPILGKVKAAGFTTPSLERKLVTLLSEGYLKKPEVSVTVKEFRSRRVFVTGEVGRPGPYPLKGDRTLLTLMADIGALHPEVGHEVIIIRPPQSDAGDVPSETQAMGTLPNEVPGAQVIHLNLKELLVSYLGHRREVTLRRTRFELRKARDRAHILEGLLKALDHIDAIITLIRSSQTGDEARSRLISEFQFSEVQAQAILDMRLQRLVGLERQKLEDEYAELMSRVTWLLSILASEAVLLGVIKGEITAVRDRYGDVRRTQIVDALGDLSLEDLVASEDQVVTVSHLGYIKRTSLTEYRMQRRGGTGKTGMVTRDQDFVESIFIANTHSYLLIFTNTGMLYWLRVYDVPEGLPTAKGKPLVNLVNLEPGVKVAAVVSVKDFQEAGVDLVFCSRRGLVKRTELSAYSNIRQVGLTACDVADGDTLLTVKLARIEQQMMITTRGGMSCRFPGDEVRHLGRVSRGVRGIDLKDGDEVVDLEVLPVETGLHLLTATSLGFGKRTELGEYKTQHRAGMGIIDIDVSMGGEKNEVVGTAVVRPGDQVMLITDTGRVIRTGTDQIREVGRNTKGVRLMRLDDGERIVAMARLAEVEEALEGEPTEGEPAEDETPPVEGGDDTK